MTLRGVYCKTLCYMNGRNLPSRPKKLHDSPSGQISPLPPPNMMVVALLLLLTIDDDQPHEF